MHFGGTKFNGLSQILCAMSTWASQKPGSSQMSLILLQGSCGTSLLCFFLHVGSIFFFLNLLLWQVFGFGSSIALPAMVRLWLLGAIILIAQLLIAS